MRSAGRKLREVRERLNLTYRQIEEATSIIATAKLNPEYYVTLSRLCGIENSQVVPSLYRIYSLCVAYSISYTEVLKWYGVDLGDFQRDAALYSVNRTHLIAEAEEEGPAINLPIRLDPGLNLKQTNYLSRMIQGWGTVPLAMLRHLDLQNQRYGRIGLDDWMMYPLITPGALVQIDTGCRKVQGNGWRNDFERPIYFLETRDSYFCCWVTPMEQGFLLQPYSLSPCKGSIRAIPDEADIVGRVTGVAMRLSAGPAAQAASTLGPR